MRKKFITKGFFIFSSLLGVSSLHAGSMGDSSSPTYRPYVGGEATYTWMQKSEPAIDNFTAMNSSRQQWGGRLSLGALRFINDRLAFSAEIAGGYYGSETATISRVSSTAKNSISGYEVLAGALYKLKYFDVFGQVGLMIQNNRWNLSQQSLGLIYQGGFVSGSSTMKLNQTETLPEIRVGGIYNITNNLGFDVAYMHAFGSSPGYSFNATATRASGISTITNANLLNPSLNVITFGLRYYFI